jgi:glycosyltransferase involved in cell wall biosynthesis
VDLEPLRSKFGPDVIHVHTVLNPAVLDWAAEHDGVITVQDHRFFCPGRGKLTVEGSLCKEPMTRELCAGCFSEPSYFSHIYSLTEERLRALWNLRVVVLSHYMKGELVAAGIPDERVTVIPPFVHGLDPEATPDGPSCVLFVGRLVEVKGVYDAVSAWRRSGISLPLVVAGTGPLRAELEGRGCEVLGWVSHRRLSALYRRAEAVVLPFHWQEPFGIVGLEALTMRAPVVAWDSGGVSEWHPGPGLVPWGDLDGLAAELRIAPDRTVDPPSGFEPESLMRRLLAVYLDNS